LKFCGNVLTILYMVCCIFQAQPNCAVSQLENTTKNTELFTRE